MEHAGSNVNLTITSTALNLTNLESGEIVASHDMPNISFASGGDPVSVSLIYAGGRGRVGLWFRPSEVVMRGAACW